MRIRLHLAVAAGLALPLVAARGQVQLPPGTSSSVSENDRQAAPSPEAAALQKAEDAIASERFADAVARLSPLATAVQKNERVFYDLGFALMTLAGRDASAAYYSFDEARGAAVVYEERL